MRGLLQSLSGLAQLEAAATHRRALHQAAHVSMPRGFDPHILHLKPQEARLPETVQDTRLHMSKLQEDLEGTRAFTGPRRKGETTKNPDREAERAL